jgi:signal transduction histidine kinase
VKIRTKLVLLLSTALVVTMAVSTVLRIRYTRNRLEVQLHESAVEAAQAIAADLQKRLEETGFDDDNINDELKNVKLRHPVSYLELALGTADEDTTTTFSLPSNTAEPKVAKRPTGRARSQQQRRDDARRALLDHGDSLRSPGSRSSEPLWRTSDRSESSRFPPRLLPPAMPHVSAVRTFQEGQRERDPIYEANVPFDPDGRGPRFGQLIVTMSREPVDQVLRNEWISSVLITGGAVLLLVIMTTLIINRIVRPVSELQLAMQRVDSGAMDVRVEARSIDELGTLARGFNAMIQRLAQADSDIRGFNRRLADEVKAATLDLARKNEALAQLNRLLLEARHELGDKERLAALGQLAAQLAHEIGTPLGSVSGHLQLAISARDLPPSLKERLQVATRELERVSKIVRDYLDSTRRVKPEPAVVDLKRLAEESIDIALGAERRARIRVALDLADEAAELFTDPSLLRQILVNLCTNAADAQPQNLTIRARAGDGQIHLSVRDDGSGISPEDVARIFEPFYTTKGRGKGTGLGLAICRELATALGGRISVESEPGRGSTFTLTLPRETTTRTAA